MKRFLATIYFTLLFAAAAFAQSAIKVDVLPVVAQDEQFTVSFTVEGDRPSSFEWNCSADFDLLWGPSTSSSSSTTFVNGKLSSNSSYTYSYVLMPKAVGKFLLPAASAKIKGKEVRSGTPTVEVVAQKTRQTSSQSQQSSARSSQPQASAQGTVSDEALFLKMTVDKRNVVVGESLVATLYLYARNVSISQFDGFKFPTLDGFWSNALDNISKVEFQRTTVDGEIYDRAVLKTVQLIPQQTGEIVIDPAELNCGIRVRAPQRNTGSVFDAFFADDYRTITKRLRSKPITINVKPLPQPAPASFGGGVGTFSISARLTKDSLKTHDAASLIVTVKGKGNLSMLSAPKINFPPDFEAYDPKVSETTGDRTFEYLFIPRSYGDFEIPAIEYSYYDVSKGSYKTVETQALPITVVRSSSFDSDTSAVAPVFAGSIKGAVSDHATAIRHIVLTVPAFSVSGSFLLGSSLFWILLAAIIVAAVAFFLAFRKVSARRADVVSSRRRAATGLAKKKLSIARKYMQDDRRMEFYLELHRALYDFVAGKLNLSASELNESDILAGLIEHGVPQKDAEAFVALLDACNFERYAPTSCSAVMKHHYDTAVESISAINGSLRSSVSGTAGSGIAVLVTLLMLVPSGAFNASAAPVADDSAAADSLWTAGCDLYSAGQWDDAADAWQQIVESGLESPQLYYNIGNAQFKSGRAGNIGRAVLYYEKALKLDPSYKDARYNLEFVQNFTVDQIDELPGVHIKEVARKMAWSMSSDAWAALFLAFMALAVALLLLYLLGRRSSGRKFGFFGAIFFAVCCLVSLLFSVWEKADYMQKDDAVVMSSVSRVMSYPDEAGANYLFLLHEGTKVKVIETVGSWAKVEISDGRQGWMPATEIEII